MVRHREPRRRPHETATNIPPDGTWGAPVRRSIWLAALILGLVLGTTSQGTATPIQVSGSLVFGPEFRGLEGLGHFVGARGFTADVHADRIEVDLSVTDCLPCSPGASIGLRVNGSGWRGVGTLDGVTYPKLGSQSSPVFLFLTIDGLPLVAPPSNVADTVSLTRSVQLTGHFTGLADAQLHADGVATVLLRHAGCGSDPFGTSLGECWRYVEATYEFAATPEPVTVALLGGTLAVAGWVAKRRRSARAA